MNHGNPDPQRHRVGVDLDNTIVAYDALAVQMATELGLIASSERIDRVELRDRLRRQGREDLWTCLQGEMYGKQMSQASVFSGVTEFFAASIQRGDTIIVISHRTRFPYFGPPVDLHAAAWNWLENFFFSRPQQLLLRENVFLEPTSAAKLERIASIQCTHFVDDLPEFLLDPGFPTCVRRILFDPLRRYTRRALPFVCLHSWSDIQSHIMDSSRRHLA